MPIQRLAFGLVLFLIPCAPGLARQAPSPGDHDTRAPIDLSRPVDTTRWLTGTVVLRVEGEGKAWPYLRANFKEYRIGTSDAAAAEAIKKCPAGEACRIRAEVTDEIGNHSLDVKTVEAFPKGEVRVTESGAVFRRARTSPKLGDAWRDPSGMVWSAVVTDGAGKPVAMTFDEARAYCAEHGASLPRKEDFERLRDYLATEPGYPRNPRPQVLVGLGTSGDRTYFWSSSPARGYDGEARAWVMRGSDLDINTEATTKAHAVLCVQTAAR